MVSHRKSKTAGYFLLGALACWLGAAVAQEPTEVGGDQAASAEASASEEQVSPDSDAVSDAESDGDAESTADADGRSATSGEEADLQEDARRARISTLREAETRTRRLKEDIFRSKTTLALLEELLIESATLGSGVRITHVNDITRGYDVTAIRYYLDGRPLFAWTSSDEGELPRELELKSETLPPGEHLLQVMVSLSGRGGGVFSYVDNIGFDLQSSHTFRVRSGHVSSLRVTVSTRGKGRGSYKERPRIMYDQGSEALASESQ